MANKHAATEPATHGNGVAVTQTADNPLKREIPSTISFDTGRAYPAALVDALGRRSWTRSFAFGPWIGTILAYLGLDPAPSPRAPASPAQAGRVPTGQD